MASRLNPYLNFPDGLARKAMEHYRSVLGGDLVVSTFGEMGMEGPMADQVMHAQLETPHGFTLMGSDAPPEMVQLTYGDNVSVSISCDSGDADAARGWFEGLSAGGQVAQPLAVAPWGAEFGMLKDRFGVAWMVNIERGDQG